MSCMKLRNELEAPRNRRILISRGMSASRKVAVFLPRTQRNPFRGPWQALAPVKVKAKMGIT